jgi:hypothetical protein
MTRGSGVWRCIGALAVMAGCGGDPFVLTDASTTDSSTDAGGGSDRASQDATSDAPPLKADVLCGNVMCVGGTCCTGVSGSGHCTVGGSCGTCETQLRCASDDNCPGLQHCCARLVADPSCDGGGYYQATCGLACVNGSALCVRNGAACPSNRGCSENANDLAAVGLPVNQGYGVCR